MSAKADGFRVSAAQTNDSLRRKAKTESGLQPSKTIMKAEWEIPILPSPFWTQYIKIGALPVRWGAGTTTLWSTAGGLTFP